MSYPQPIEDIVDLQDPGADPPPGPGPAAIPRPLTPFVGRERPVADVVALLRNNAARLVTLTGPGGVGKTRLALAAADALSGTFRDGVYFVPLAPVVDPAMVIPAIASALDVSSGGDRTLLAQVTQHLAHRRVLLILDNMEQVLSAAPAIPDLLQSVKGVAALVTSRSPLRVTGEHEYPVAPLELPNATRPPTPADLAQNEAVALFVQRAQSVRPGFEIDDANVAAVAEICRRLDGLPLALELAAARTKVLNPGDLLARLERKLYVLTGGRSDSPARQRTMRDAIAWSYGLLDEEHQALFRRLAVFRGGFSIAMAEQLLSDAASPATVPHVPGANAAPSLDVLDSLEQLVDQSLLVRDERVSGESRLLMLETIREFGLEQLALHGEESAVYTGFAAYWHTLAEASWEDAQNLESLSRSLDRLEADHDNIRAALDWLETRDPGGAIALAGALFWLWSVHGHHAEALHRLQRLLATPPPETAPHDLARALTAAGAFAQFQVRHDEATRFAGEALAIWRSLNDPWGIGFAQLILGLIAEDAGDYHPALALLEEAIASLETAGDAAMVGSAKYHLATVAFGLGRLDEAESILASVIDSRGTPAPRIAAWALNLRGLVAHALGKPELAFGYIQAGLRRFIEAKTPAGIGESLASISVVLASLNDPTAARFWAAGARTDEELGQTYNQPELGVYESAMDRLSSRIGPEAFATQMAIGRAWTTEEAIEAALALDPDFQTSGSAPSPGKPTLPNGLSAREAEVLRLVVDGMTNDRIAEELFLSPRTVHAHLTSVYRKLGVANRTEAARIARERGIA